MKEHEQKEFERLSKLADALDRHPATIQQREKEAAETLVKRTAAADKIKDLELDLQATGIIEKEIKTMLDRLAVMDAERIELQNSINEKRSFMWREKSGTEGEIRHEQQILLSCYDPAIDEAIQFFRDKLDELRKPGKISRNALGGEGNIYTEKIIVRQESNEEAVIDALKYCQGAIPKLNEMKLAAALDLTELERLKVEIPRIDIYREVEGERPMAKGPDMGFLAKVHQALNDKTAELLRRRV